MRRTRVFRWAIIGAALATITGGASLAAESGLGLNHDAKQKIVINADSMEVHQNERLANFKGNVVAVQGDLTMKADSVKVYYSLQQGAGGAENADTTQIQRIDAEGHVRITSPSESATGSWGIYDVGRDLLTLGGEVVLNRGQTKIEGSRLELDLKTGKSRMVSASSADQSGRVRGVFAPPQNDKPKDQQNDQKTGQKDGQK
jgi:lipopolysaccharide export system protein LptA